MWAPLHRPCGSGLGTGKSSLRHSAWAPASRHSCTTAGKRHNPAGASILSPVQPRPPSLASVGSGLQAAVWGNLRCFHTERGWLLSHLRKTAPAEKYLPGAGPPASP